MNEDFIKQFRRLPDPNFVEKIHRRLERRERIQAIKRYSAFAAFALIFGLGILMTFSSTVRAAVLQTIEEIAGLRFEVTTNYPGVPDEEVTIVPSEYLSLEEAQSRFPSPIALPIYVPKGYERRADIIFFVLGDMPVVIIKWHNKGGEFHLDIKHCPSGAENCGRIVGEGALEEIMLNGRHAVIVRGGWNYDTKQYELPLDGFAIMELMWKYDDQTVYVLRADEREISIGELIKIAESIP
jgi:hypothetical protein